MIVVVGVRPRSLIVAALLAALAISLPGPCQGVCPQIEERGCCPDSSEKAECCCGTGLEICCEAPKVVVSPLGAPQVSFEVAEAPAAWTLSPLHVSPTPVSRVPILAETDLYLRIRVLLI